MRFAPALAAVVASIGLAAAAHADPGDEADQAFLAALADAHITYHDREHVIKAGQKVCDLANSGASELDIIRDIRDLNPAFTMTSAARFAKAAASAYCPDRLAADGDAANVDGQPG